MTEKTGKYSGLIGKAKEIKQTEPAPPPVEEKIVSLTIKVPLSHRNHWQAESKRSGSTITADITEFLKSKYGLPQ
ncbi:MAG: hypothetical protein AAFO06_04610 [Cyanobacteria bacterium J06597_16]